MPLLLLFALLLPACLQKRIDLLERDIETLQLENETLREKVSQLEIALTAQEKLDLLAEIDEIRRNAKRLGGLLERQAHRSETTRKEVALLKEYLYSRVQSLETRLSFIEERLRIRAPASGGEEEKPAEDPALAAARFEERYEEARESYRRGDPMAAREKLKMLIAESDPTLVHDRALFLLAECDYDAKIYDEAFLAYQDLIDRFPKSPKVPEAILKQAFCLLALGKEAEAKAFLLDLAGRYPRSEAAKIARGKLKELEP